MADLTDEQRRADRDVAQVRARQTRDRGLLDSGSVSDPKSMERMLGEIESLNRRVRDLEDAELEVMERLEEAQGGLTSGESELAELDAGLEQTRSRAHERAEELKDSGRELTRERAATADGVPEELIALYQRLRESKGGTGAAELRARQCGGCRLALDASELETIRHQPAEEVIRCAECGRILVRTSESGL